MKAITISTENSETYSSISNFFIDYYMTEANGEFVKVYLYLVRLLNKNAPITVAAIADHFNLTENDICRAIKYWISKDVLKLSYDGKGVLNGIVLLPLHAPILGEALDTDAISILQVSAPKPSLKPTVSNVKEFTAPKETKPLPYNQDKVITDDAANYAPVKPSFTKKDFDRIDADEDWGDIIYQIETLFKKKQLSQNDLNSILYIYDTLSFDIELFEYLIEYCTTMGKPSCRYMEVVAIGWYKDGIKTKQQAKEQYNMISGITRTVFKSLGIKRATPTNIEIAYINTWSKDFAFSPELIRLACDKAVTARPNSANFAYINGILENWNKNNVKTIEDVDRLDKAFATQAASSHSGQQTKNVSSFRNFKQTKLDDELDEMEKLLFKEVNS